jgi:hypothetical protein
MTWRARSTRACSPCIVSSPSDVFDEFAADADEMPATLSFA